MWELNINSLVYEGFPINNEVLKNIIIENSTICNNATNGEGLPLLGIDLSTHTNEGFGVEVLERDGVPTKLMIVIGWHNPEEEASEEKGSYPNEYEFGVYDERTFWYNIEDYLNLINQEV